MPHQYDYHRQPAIYTETLARRKRDAFRAIERQAGADGKRIADAIDKHGERMSEEGLALLTALMGTLKKIGDTLRWR